MTSFEVLGTEDDFSRERFDSKYSYDETNYLQCQLYNIFGYFCEHCFAIHDEFRKYSREEIEDVKRSLEAGFDKYRNEFNGIFRTEE